MSRTIFDVLFRGVCFSSFLLVCAALGAPAPIPAKIDPRIWQDSDNGNTASFLVLLAEQSDSKGKVKDVGNRKDKRRAVVDGLRETAQRSQGDWVANVIAVEGKRGLVQSLAKRDDVKAIESNRAFRVPLEQPSIASLAAIQQATATAAIEPNLA